MTTTALTLPDDVRAFTVKQPWAWGICYADKRIENRPMPFWSTIPTPATLLLHAGASIDTNAVTTNDYGGRFWTPPTMEMLTLLEWSQNPVHADHCECNEDDESLDGRCAELSAADMQLAFAPDPGAHMYNPLGMGTTKPWCKQCGGTGWVGEHDGHHCTCDNEPVDQYNAWVHLGAIVAVATITGSHKECASIPGACWIDGGYVDGGCSPWAMFDDQESGLYAPVHHWEIGDVHVLPEPVPAAGALGPWRPNPETIRKVEEQL